MSLRLSIAAAVGSLVLAIPIARAAPPDGAPAPPGTVRTFAADPVDAPPSGFSFGRTGSGRPGKWVVHAEPGGGKVLAQVDADDTDSRFPVAVLDAPILRDVRVSVRCKAVSGRVDRACGLVARYLDEDTYLLTRANALEDNVRLYVVKNGQRHQLASWSGKVSSGAWHQLRLEVRGDHLEVSWDGKKVLDHHDGTLSQAGRAGLWTKADSVTVFDELRVEAP